MKTDTEILTAAWRELGWESKKEKLPSQYYRGMSIETVWRRLDWPPGVFTRENECELPRLLASLDAHFAPGGTVEWMRERGFALDMFQQFNGWRVVFYKVDVDEDYQSTDPNPARAITLAFVQHEEGKP